MADLQAALSEAVKLNRSISQFLKFSTYTDYDDLSGLDIDFTDGEQLLLWEELRRITDKLADVEEYMDAPETAHIDQPAAVSLTGTDLDVTWEVTSEDGAVVENALTNSGRIPQCPLLDPDYRGTQRRGLLPRWLQGPPHGGAARPCEVGSIIHQRSPPATD